MAMLPRQRTAGMDTLWLAVVMAEGRLWREEGGRVMAAAAVEGTAAEQDMGTLRIGTVDIATEGGGRRIWQSRSTLRMTTGEAAGVGAEGDIDRGITTRHRAARVAAAAWGAEEHRMGIIRF